MNEVIKHNFSERFHGLINESLKKEMPLNYSDSDIPEPLKNSKNICFEHHNDDFVALFCKDY